MTDLHRPQEPPGDVRELDVTADPDLSSVEKEVRMVSSSPDEEFTISTEIPTIIKWLQSVPAASFEWVRMDSERRIVACKAKIPKGIVKLQATARKSNQHSQMVSYGELRGGDDG